MILCLAALLLTGTPPNDSRPLAIVGATLIDGTGAARAPDSVLVVKDGRIVAAGPKGTPIPEGAERVDAAGKWLIPGLIDLHVHLDEVLTPSAFPLFGVTSVRDVGSRLVTIQRLRSRASRGEPMPRLFWMGRNIDQGKPSWWGAVAVKGPEQVPALLADMARQGVDGVKCYVASGPEVTRAVIREAHRRGWPVTGHLKRTKPSDAAQIGIDNLEHISTLLDELRRQPPGDAGSYRSGFLNVAEVGLQGPAARRLIDSLKKNHVAVTATLSVSCMPAEGEANAEKVYADWAGLPDGWRSEWKRPYWDFISTKGWLVRNHETARRAYRKYEEMVRLLDRAGVPIVAGTDTPAPWVLPGAGLVHELELLVEAGLTPMAAIRAATGRAAEVLRKENEVGALRPGRRADFVLLDADPLKDISNLRRVHAVYEDGRPVDLRAARQMLEAARPGH